MNLFRELDILGVQQVVYNPIREAKYIGRNKIELKEKGSRIVYSPILNYHLDRFFYKLKIRKILKDLETKIDFSTISFVHAHTWYSDGGVAYLLHKKYKIPYVIAIRSTDVNIFYKYFIHERFFGRKILKNAQKTILISASYKSKVFNFSFLKAIRGSIDDKLEIIPNGVAPYWIQHSHHKNLFIKSSSNEFNILYIGSFINRKHLPILQKAIIDLSAKNKIKLHIVGGGGKDEKEVLKHIQSYPHLFNYYGKILDKNKLREIMNACDIFAMPSRNETFGLVYVEAMLQGLPILYTKGEGIDGFYEENIGEKVRNFSIDEIRNKLEKMINHYDDYKIPIEKIKKNHNWSSIARTYIQIYSK